MPACPLTLAAAAILITADGGGGGGYPRAAIKAALQGMPNHTPAVIRSGGGVGAGREVRRPGRGPVARAQKEKGVLILQSSLT